MCELLYHILLCRWPMFPCTCLHGEPLIVTQPDAAQPGPSPHGCCKDGGCDGWAKVPELVAIERVLVALG